MISYTQDNLLDADVDALVNTVNTVGVMGKGIALMFKERFTKNTALFEKACKAGDVQTGKMFVTETGELMGPRWIVNFPTKQHWRAKSRIPWIIDGLADLRRFIEQHQVQSIAIPPLGAGNGGLDWAEVKLLIEQALGDLDGVDIVVYEPTAKYQNVAKARGVGKADSCMRSDRRAGPPLLGAGYGVQPAGDSEVGLVSGACHRVRRA